ncbi:MAG: hypothetical protein ACRDI2_00750, partial [Chloroflexota bacterium]
ATAILSNSPGALPGLTFERVIHVSPSGLLRLSYRVTNAGAVQRTLRVSAETGVSLSMARASKVAAPLASGLVVEDSQRFPDWQEPELGKPERYAETWMAEFGDGWVGATLWQGAKEITAGWDTPSLIFDLGAIPPGGQAETPPLYLYAGQGDWKTARALWRQLIAPDAPEGDPQPRRAHTARLEPFVFAEATAETRVVLESERARGLSGTVALELAGAEIASAEVNDLRLGAPQSAPVRVSLPARAAAVLATLVLSHERSTERYAAALVRAGVAGKPVTLDVERDGATELVRLHNGRLRLTVAPATLARVMELSVQDADGQWVNQLHASYPEPSTFVWFNPWYGGIHPTLSTGGGWGHPGKLREETFTWREIEQTGRQGIRWRGLTAATETRAIGQAGLHLDVSYLTTGESNLLATVMRLENRSGARVGGELYLGTFLQPGGDRKTATLHYERHGLRNQKRVHGGMWSSSEQWCALEAKSGLTLAVISAKPDARIETRDMGLEGAHPDVAHTLNLAPGEALESVTYLAVCDDLAQARLYRYLAEAGGLV